MCKPDTLYTARMRKFQVTVAVALVVLGTGYLIFSASTAEGIVYKTATEMRQTDLGNRGLRLTGHVKEGTIEKYPAERRVEFVVIDHDSAEIRATYTGVVPDTFKDKSEVVVSGTYDRGRDLFVATDLLAKCPSKYQGSYDTSLSAPPAQAY